MFWGWLRSTPYVMSFQSISDFVVIKLARELLNQGHQNTGKLISSLQGKVTTLSNGIEISVVTDRLYWRQVNNGVKANRIPFGGRTGRGGKSAYIQALIAYFKQKGLGEKEAKSAAFATATKHKKEGMPTKKSFRFSSTGKRTDFIQEMLTRHGQNIEDQMFEQGFNNISTQIDVAFAKLDQ